MERRDYLSKEIEKLGQLLAKLTGLKLTFKPDEFRLEAEKGYVEYFGLDFATLDLAALQAKIRAVGDVQQLEFLAEMLELDIETLNYEPDAKQLRQDVLGTVVAEIDRLYADQGTFSLTNQLRKK